MTDALRIVHTADNHLDPPALSFGPKRFERRRDHMRCFGEVINYAVKERADILTISGDMFDTIRPGNRARAEVMNLLRTAHESGVRIFMVSGHHDTPKSLEEGISPLAVYGRSGYAHYFEFPSVIRFELRERRVDVGGIGFNPLLQAGEDPLTGFNLPSDANFRLMLTHYPIEGFEGYYGNEPLVKGSSIPSRAQLIAAGHLHKFQRRKFGNTEVIFSGSTERATFAEEEEKGFAWVELSLDGEVHAENIHTTARKYQTLEADLTNAEDIMDGLLKILRAQRNPELVMRLRVKGTVQVDKLAQYRRSELVNRARDEGLFFHLAVDEEPLNIIAPRPLEALPRTKPSEELRRYFEKLLHEAQGEEREILEEAYRESLGRLEEAGGW